MANYISCSGCGMTYLENAERRCPHCGVYEERSASGFDLAEMRFCFDQLPLKSVVVMLITVLVLAALNFMYSAMLNSNFDDERELYKQAKVVVESGQYNEVLREYNEMKDKIDSGYKFTQDQLAEFEKLEDAISQLPSDVYTAMAQAEGMLNYIDLLIVANVVISVAYIIAGVLVLLRFRLSFRILMGALGLGIAGLVIFDLWGVIMGYKSFSIGVIVYYAACCFSIFKECIGCDALVYRNTMERAAAPAVVGAAMPKVQELYSFEDMPELSGMKGLDAELERQDIQDKDDVMDSIDPIGVANTTADKPMFKPSEVAPDVEPVVPLTNYQVGGSITDDGENVAVTPLQRPMFEVDMMEDEVMPVIGGVEESEPVIPQPEPVQSAVSAKGIWFCSVCGSLNENIAVCDTCGADKQ